MTSLFLLTKHRGKYRGSFSTGFIQKTLAIPASCRFFIRKTDEISTTLRLMHDGITKTSGDHFGTKLTENKLAAPRRCLV
jgi:hypothetical protein